VFAWGSDSSEKLALTPYRQAGRPARIEADLMLGYPLIEGVSTPRFSFIPALEMVFFVNLGLRYRYYPHELDKMATGTAVTAFFAPQLSDTEVNNLEYERLPGMAIDRTRYDLLGGLSLCIYFQNGFFFMTRYLASVSFGGVTGPGISIWWDLSESVGWSF
jgi:hypothetical protein